jgi:SEC-C motif domain protein
VLRWIEGGSSETRQHFKQHGKLRSTSMESKKICPCQSGLKLEECCGPLLLGHEIAKTPEQLMRSRYSAFARKNLAYLERTWHPSTRPKIESSDKGAWVHLQILSTSIDSEISMNEGQVEFIALHIFHDTLTALHELSRFQKIDDNWFYVSGELKGSNETNQTIAYGQPCPCQSGRKFGKCHLKPERNS